VCVLGGGGGVLGLNSLATVSRNQNAREDYVGGGA